MAEQPAQERTEKATPKRRADARKEGKVARSQELSSLLLILFGMAALYLVLPHSFGSMIELMKFLLSNAGTHAISAVNFSMYFRHVLMTFAIAIGPVLLILTIVGLAASVLQVGFMFTTKPLEPKFDKLNVVNGIQKFISARSLFELLKNVLKLAFIGIVAFYAVKAELKTAIILPDLSIEQIISMFGAAAFRVALKCCMVLAILAIIDFAYQKYDFEKSIRMTKQEIKEESKDTEGNPQIKGRIRQIQRQQAMARMMSSVQEADVVVTNPTEFAVAIKYDSGKMDAPTVIAKGQRLIAQRIKEIAREHDIPVIENKPLARALFKACDVGMMIPPKFFKAVAEVLAYVYKLKGRV